ncbi:hypothetical protein [Carnobacterium funditum]|uniref:hypothetical protein n=1 Tax=Carnobacterium funditum TaxID=2752 RepID=UPI0005505B7D|nr:hypothetical protein [Carnobacterium funditum]
MDKKQLNVIYAYIIEGKDAKSTLNIAEEDLIENADGILDCPFDSVLRKHNLTSNDLNKMHVSKLTFVKFINEATITLKTIELNINL